MRITRQSVRADFQHLGFAPRSIVALRSPYFSHSWILRMLLTNGEIHRFAIRRKGHCAFVLHRVEGSHSFGSLPSTFFVQLREKDISIFLCSDARDVISHHCGARGGEIDLLFFALSEQHRGIVTAIAIE